MKKQEKKAVAKVEQKDEISVNIRNAEIIFESAKEIFVTQKAEDAIVALLNLQKYIDDAVDRMKKYIADAGMAHNPNFTSIKGDRVRISYRQYGGKYAIDEKYASEVPKELFKTKIQYSPNTKEIDAWVENFGALPLGINERERSKSVSISMKK